MNQPVELFLIKKPVQQGFFPDIAVDKLVSSGMLLRDIIEIHRIAGISQGIQVDDVPAGSLRKCEPDKIGADKPCPARHQYGF